MYLVGDIGGTHIRLGVSNDLKTILSSTILDTPGSFEKAMALIKTKSFDLTMGEKIELAAFGVAGPLDQFHNKLTKAPNLPGWEDKPLKELLTTALNTIVYIENDAAVGALGEAVFGAGQSFKIVGFLTIGTGVGGAKVVNGELDPNIHGFEPGNQIIDGEHTLEDLVSGNALEKLYNQKAEDIKSPEVWDKVERSISIGINNLSVAWSPEIIILNGSVIKSVNIQKIKDFLTNTLKIQDPPQISASQLGDEAGLYGGLVLLNNLH